jgi:hypothetical protein
MAAMAVNAVGGERKRCKDETKEARRRMRITSLASSWSKRKLAAMAAHGDDDHVPPSSAIDGGECYVEAMIMDDLLLYILGCGLLSIRDLYPVSLVCRYVPAIVCRVVGRVVSLVVSLVVSCRVVSCRVVCVNVCVVIKRGIVWCVRV